MPATDSKRTLQISQASEVKLSGKQSSRRRKVCVALKLETHTYSFVVSFRLEHCDALGNSYELKSDEDVSILGASWSSKYRIFLEWIRERESFRPYVHSEGTYNEMNVQLELV